MTPHWTARPCRAPSLQHGQRAWLRQQQLTKPRGALGRLETLAAELAALQGRDRPQAARVPVIVFAGDHGVSVRGVSAYPTEVTVQMLHNFGGGGAAISVLARELGSPLYVVDAGTLATRPIPGVRTDKPCLGTADFSVAPAMTANERDHALEAGRRAVEKTTRPGVDVLVLGEMGIGNTAAASTLACALAGLASTALVGAGTGLDAVRIRHKQDVVERALALHGGAISRSPTPALEALGRVGGLEIAALAGAIIAAAQRGVPVLVDGFIVSVAAMVAVRLNPGARPWLLFSHRSAERGHACVLDVLGADTLLQLDLRLGEGSGAALAIPLLRLACALHNDMATFEQAAVSVNDDARPA
ncbi:nicotinate-nucleotide--dimethylbenzimidazole phosphoribosyltransferase [Lysobacter sp. GX 14042]|uniref:nicotinate-nucleotide--dimethylbenzimidazole phosphoribosyltransferase n=1 Tax=Lysobacter sp. GX 14042 TaxID=2907155 RepID=UPI001F37ACDF|nr:nicotinate-nucleotide--dimethylbenzimidazole phosphoribosyltransferase [Lysobacter sp. GX 14042]